MLTINWKKKFEEETAKGLRSIVDDLCEQVGDDGQDIVFAWVGEHTFRLMAQAASTVLEAMAEQENYLEREGYLPGDLSDKTAPANSSAESAGQAVDLFAIRAVVETALEQHLSRLSLSPDPNDAGPSDEDLDAKIDAMF